MFVIQFYLSPFSGHQMSSEWFALLASSYQPPERVTSIFLLPYWVTLCFSFLIPHPLNVCSVLCHIHPFTAYLAAPCSFCPNSLLSFPWLVALSLSFCFLKVGLPWVYIPLYYFSILFLTDIIYLPTLCRRNPKSQSPSQLTSSLNFHVYKCLPEILILICLQHFTFNVSESIPLHY